MGIRYPEFVDNPENRCPVVLILDTSASMEGDPLRSLNAGLASFKFDVEQDEMAALRVEVAIVTFGKEVQVLQNFVTVDNFTAPQLQAEGRTPLGEAIEKGLDLLEERKKIYREGGVQYYRPWVFLITDGAPTDGEKWLEVSDRVHKLEQENRLSFFTIGVEGADFDILQQISPPSRPPLYLKDLQFEELFRWLSSSVRRVSAGKIGGEMIALPALSTWYSQH
jgi:uncharacterized protein YegL